MEKQGHARHIWDICIGVDGLWGMLVIKMKKYLVVERAKFE